MDGPCNVKKQRQRPDGQWGSIGGMEGLLGPENVLQPSGKGRPDRGLPNKPHWRGTVRDPRK